MILRNFHGDPSNILPHKFLGPRPCRLVPPRPRIRRFGGVGGGTRCCSQLQPSAAGVEAPGGKMVAELVGAFNDLTQRMGMLPVSTTTATSSHLLLFNSLKLSIPLLYPLPSSVTPHDHRSPLTRALSVASLLGDLQMDAEVISAGILRVALENGVVTLRDVKRQLGVTTAHLVHDSVRLTKLPSTVDVLDNDTATLLRRYCLTYYDIRAIVLELSLKLDRMRNLRHVPRYDQQVVALEVLQIYAPLAHAIGVGSLSLELEDLSFRYLFPYSYLYVDTWLRNHESVAKPTLIICKKLLHQALNSDPVLQNLVDGITIKSRYKSRFSTMKKLLKDGRRPEQVHDLLGLRVILEPKPGDDTVERGYKACHRVHQVIRTLWKDIPSRTKDYISKPKKNGYRSLHVAVDVSDSGKAKPLMEIQIRTAEMEALAGGGSAAHSLYKGGFADPAEAKRLKDIILAAAQFAALRLKDIPVANQRGNLEADQSDLVFHLLDKNGDGRISMDELTEVIEELGAESEDAHELMQLLDVNSDGSLSSREFDSFQRQVDFMRKMENKDSEYGDILGDKLQMTDSSGLIQDLPCVNTRDEGHVVAPTKIWNRGVAVVLLPRREGKEAEERRTEQVNSDWIGMAAAGGGGGGTVALAAGLSRKLKKVLDTRTDSPDLLSSLATLSTFYTDNTPKDRRGLKSTIESRTLRFNYAFLLASLPAQQALDLVEEEVDALAQCCDRISRAIAECTESTGDIITTTERLQHDLEITTQRQEIVSCFLRDYQLSPDEVDALRVDDLSEAFFRALSHVHEIHANCKTLLRTHHQRAGLELMDMMAAYQEGAYERLCRWVQTECKKLGDTDNPEVSELLKMAVCCLKERPVLYKYCAEEVANMRHHALFRRFITALTRGGPGGLPRPIEVHAHDPLRYVGDMLGWLHQALASERELILALLDRDSTLETGPTEKQLFKASTSDVVKLEPDTKCVLDRIFEGACRPFKVRVDQVLQSQPTLIVSYKLSNMLEFYGYTISDLLGKEAALCNTIEMLKNASQQTVFNILKTRGEKLLKYPPLVAADLSPPPAVREGVSLLLEIIETYNSMMIPASRQKPEFDPVIKALLNPIIQMCERAAEAHKSKGSINTSRRRTSSDLGQSKSESSPIDAFLAKTSSSFSQGSETPSKIFLINCLCAIQQPLIGQEPAEKYVKDVGAMIETHLNILLDKEVDIILRRCGLLDKMVYFQDSVGDKSVEEATPLAEIQATSPQSLLECLRTFFGLVTGTEGSLSEFELMQVPSLRSDACQRIARALAEVYELIYKVVADPKNCYPDPKLLLRHTPDQIRTILAI